MERGSGGVQKLIEKLEAENEGAQVPSRAGWLGGAAARDRCREGRSMYSSVALSVRGRLYKIRVELYTLQFTLYTLYSHCISQRFTRFGIPAIYTVVLCRFRTNLCLFVFSNFFSLLTHTLKCPATIQSPAPIPIARTVTRHPPPITHRPSPIAHIYRTLLTHTPAYSLFPRNSLLLSISMLSQCPVPPQPLNTIPTNLAVGIAALIA